MAGLLAGKTIGVIGAGNMAEALVKGLVAAGGVRPEDIVVSDPEPRRRELFARMGVKATQDNAEVARGADVLVLAVKPQVMEKVVKEVAGHLGEGAVILSIAAGVPTEKIERWAAKSFRVIRAMPNIPMLIGKGVCGLARGRHAGARDAALVEELLGCSAKVVRTDTEEQMHAVTAVSGSGPAYFFYLAEVLMDAAVGAGLSEEQARELVKHTALGAAAMMAGGDESPAELRRKVTSPGGTTEAAMETLEGANYPDIITKAIGRAIERSRELGEDPCGKGKR